MKEDFLYKDVSYQIRGACFWVWKEFGNAFKESIIDNTLTEELKSRGLKVETQKRIDIFYKGKKVGIYMPDKIVNNCILIETKYKPFLTKGDIKQFWRYLKATNYKIGFLVNFGDKGLQIKRIVYDSSRKKDLREDLRNRSASRSAFTHNRSASGSAFTLIEVLVGTFLMLIVFLGIFGAYQLSLKVVGLSKNKITATAIANEWLEKIRNLAYGDVGTIGVSPSPPYAQGVLEPATNTILNNVQYNVNITIKYIVDGADGLVAPDDECPNDYKQAEVKVSWKGLFGGQVALTTDITPKNLSEECEIMGGILSVMVFDAYGATISFPLIEIKDPVTDNLIDFYSPDDGLHYFPLATSTYKVVVSKPGYSSERTYETQEVVTPEKPHPIVLEGQITNISFSIDKVSSFLVKTFSPWDEGLFSDSFSDQNKISEKSDLIVSDGKVTLAISTDGYLSSGYLFSVAISPQNLIKWGQFIFTGEEPTETDLKYQIYYASSTDWILIPDSDLLGNSTGFDSSPVDLSNLATTTYSQLKLKGNFSTNSTSTTPILYDWQVSWRTSLPTPIPNATFNLKGEKLIGRDINENPVYKYSISTSTDSQGQKKLQNLEWDNYHFSIPPETGLDLFASDPPQPVSLPPDTNLTVNLYLEAQNSLLVTVQDFDTLQPIFSALTTLTGSNYQKTQYTNEKGQTLFIPLEVGSYNLFVEAPGYSSTSTTVYISGDNTQTLKLKISD